MGLTKKQVADIVEERLGNYRRRCLEEGATPLMCIGVTHGCGSQPSGHPVLMCLENWGPAKVKDWLLAVAHAIDN